MIALNAEEVKESMFTTMKQNSILPIIQELPTIELAQKLDELNQNLDVKDIISITKFGSEGRKKLADLSAKIADTKENKELGDTGEVLTQASLAISDFESTGKPTNVITRFFKKIKDEGIMFKTRYDTANDVIAKVDVQLDEFAKHLEDNMVDLQSLRDECLKSAENMELYRLACVQKLQEEQVTLSSMKSSNSRLPHEISIQEGNVSALEKKEIDLKKNIYAALKQTIKAQLLLKNAFDEETKIIDQRENMLN
ncbi:MAG: toxic anion resistance protein, partial [Candidatus Peribacteria bacterium]|nr:toxic anion resistance protein [Candidatus Peribacteria bacterium]